MHAVSISLISASPSSFDLRTEVHRYNIVGGGGGGGAVGNTETRETYHYERESSTTGEKITHLSEKVAVIFGVDYTYVQTDRKDTQRLVNIYLVNIRIF